MKEDMEQAKAPQAAQEGAPAQDTLAPHHLRLFALLIDFFAATVAVKFITLWATSSHWDLTPPSQDKSGLALQLGATLVLLAFRDVAAGRSLGKLVAGVAARDAANPSRPVSAGANLLRNATLVLFPVEAVVVFTDPYCRRLGDRLAGTVVIMPAKQPHLGRRLLLLTSLAMVFMLISLVMPEQLMKRSAAYQTAEEALGRQDLAAIVGADPSVDRFQVDIEPDQTLGQAKVLFDLDGGNGKGQLTVFLTLNPARDGWLVERVEVKTPEQIKAYKTGPPPTVKTEPAPATLP